MKFSLNRDHLTSGLQQVINVVSSRPAMPVLKNVLIEASEGMLSLTTTNLDLGIRCRIKADVKTPGSITLPVRKFASIVRELPNQEVEIVISGEHTAKISSGSSKFEVVGIKAAEFPALPTFDNKNTFRLEQGVLQRMLKAVSYAQSADESRYIMNGTFFDFQDGQLTLVATDGRRLATISHDLPGEDGAPGSVIMPSKTVAELERLLGSGNNLKIGFNERQVAFEMKIGEDGESHGLIDSVYLVSKIVEGRYPDYRQVIPKETEHRVKLERELFHESVSRAALVADEKNEQVKLRVTKNLLEIFAESAELGKAHEVITIAYDGPEVMVAFNPKFLLDPLRALPNDEIFFEFKDELSPGVLRTLDAFLCVIMPLRLN
jgi:DNA polymerase-3 subunit beta